MTGLDNAKLGTFLFLASEIMLFGALFSALVMLRTGVNDWPSGVLDIRFGSVNTFLLILSSISINRSVTTARKGDRRRFFLWLHLTTLLTLFFLAIKGMEYYGKLNNGELPSKDSFHAIYFTLTGIHVLHVIAGIAVNLTCFIAVKGSQLTSRAECVGLYWYFVDIIWLLIFGTLYL
jgi:heme/copper-type cytochrome/quinol oxidase subunit 3